MMEGLPISLLTILFCVIVVLAKSKKKSKQAKKYTSSQSSSFTQKELRSELKNPNGKIHDPGHTHDRLDYDCYANDSGSFQHYKLQLDSFLKAGIIDRVEYRVLYDRYRKSILKQNIR